MYNDESKKLLLNEFEQNKYPDRNTIERLASKTKSTYKQVHNWFAHRRSTLNNKKRTRNRGEKKVWLAEKIIQFF